MHYYQFHVADYAAHTRHLSPIEDLAYRRLLDLYYLHERAPRGEPEQIARLLNLREHVEEVRCVLSEFFEHRDGAWIQGRVELEIEAYRERKAVASRAGEASGAARRSKRDAANGRSTDVERNAPGRSTDVQQALNGTPGSVEPTINQEPRTMNQEPERGRERARETPPAELRPGRLPDSPSGAVVEVRAPVREEAPRSDAGARPSTRASSVPIAAPTPSQAPQKGNGAPPSPEAILEAWSEAGLPAAQRNEVELLLDRAVRLKPDRTLDWCRSYFARIAASPWCRGEVHSHPGSRAWTLDYALGSEKRIADVLAGKFDDRIASERGIVSARPGKQFSILGLPEEDLARMLGVNPKTERNGSSRVNATVERPALGAGERQS
jgi:uncharacterized protein YdaU (DUF1376 family)